MEEDDGVTKVRLPGVWKQGDEVTVRHEDGVGYPGSLWDYEVPPLPRGGVSPLVRDVRCSFETFDDEGNSPECILSFHEPGVYEIIVQGVTDTIVHVAPSFSKMIDRKTFWEDEALLKRHQEIVNEREEDEAQYHVKHMEKSSYEPLHEEIRTWANKRWVSEDRKVEVLPNTNHRIYLIRNFFRQEFIGKINEELHHAIANFSHLDWARPNTMNNYGFVLRELGFGDFLDHLVREELETLRRELFPEFGKLDSHHAFTISYEADKDIQLDRHMDLSEVTLNICLQRDDDTIGGDVYYEGERETTGSFSRFELTHPVNSAVFHIGQMWHGSTPLMHGKRTNLVVWGRSTQFRSSPLQNLLTTKSTTIEHDEL